MRQYAATLDDVDVECTFCGMRMTPHLGSGRRVRYFHCAGCYRWVSSSYQEVFKVDAKVRALPKSDEARRQAGFQAVKERLERWLAATHYQDPYRVLGVSPGDGMEVVRARYHELALLNHPDRGGSVGKMRELNAAYERIQRHRERRTIEQLAAGAPAQSSLPTNAM